MTKSGGSILDLICNLLYFLEKKALSLMILSRMLLLNLFWKQIDMILLG
jgi:hypothetical protein